MDRFIVAAVEHAFVLAFAVRALQRVNPVSQSVITRGVCCTLLLPSPPRWSVRELALNGGADTRRGGELRTERDPAPKAENLDELPDPRRANLWAANPSRREIKCI